ncbi:hypothetical protein BJ878DRAFT_445041 [Calycina marina]|uniref:Uncharacterized protein n=1 Tax=Calycina marina TaxID=1763456 RepID=A0A9P7Z0K8_9HELO|nr:hypothetical protein BJ878DRAFT_445041 [Calycina marina]
MVDRMDTSGALTPPGLLSPAPSNVSGRSTHSNLPVPRTKPLKSGSVKEDATRRWLENKLQHIDRRYNRKLTPDVDGLPRGYLSMTEVSNDLSEIVDVLWLSATPSLQIPYLLTVALGLNSYLPSFPAAPKATFALLRKLDHAFTSLLNGQDSIAGETLPGSDPGRTAGLSKTDMVRINGIAQSTRVAAVEAMSKGVEEEPQELSDSDAHSEVDDWSTEEDVDENDMKVATVYQDTITALGEILVTSTIQDVVMS